MDPEKDLLHIAKIELLGYLVEEKYSRGQLVLEDSSQSILDVDLEAIPVSHLIAALRAGGTVSLVDLKAGTLFEKRENTDRTSNASDSGVLSFDSSELSSKDYKNLCYDMTLCCWRDVVKESGLLIDLWRRSDSPPQDLVPEYDALGNDIDDINVIDADDLLEAFRSQLEISQTDAIVLEQIVSHAYGNDEQERTSGNFSLESIRAAISAIPSVSQPKTATSHQKRHCKSLCHGILECLKQKNARTSSTDSSPQSIALRSKVIGEMSRLSELITVFAIQANNKTEARAEAETEAEIEAETETEIETEAKAETETETKAKVKTDTSSLEDQTLVYEDAIHDMNKVLDRVRDTVGELRYPPTMAFYTYMQLLTSIFDLLEEDKIVEEAGLYLGLFRCFWKPLNIKYQSHLAMLALTMSNQYQSICARLDGGPVHLLDSVRSIFAAIMDAQAIDVEDETSCQYTRKSIESVKQMAKQEIRSFILKDFTDAADDDDYWESVLGIVNALSLIFINSSEIGMQALAHTLGDHERCNEIVVAESNALVKFCCACLFEKFSSQKPRGKQSPIAYKGKLLEGLSKDLYQGVISSALKAADVVIGVDKRRNGSCISIAALELHRLLGDHLRDLIQSLESSSPEVFQFLEQAEKLEIQLLSLIIAGLPTQDEDKLNGNGPAKATRNATFVTDSIQQSLCGGLHCWAVGQNSQLCMSNWLATQTQNFKVWVDRVLSVESWSSDDSKQHAASAVDISTIVSDALETLLKVKISLPRGILRGLAESIDGTLQTFAEAACENIGDINTVVPPIPPLTRFKAGLAEKEDEKQKKKLKTKITEPEIQKLCRDPPDHNLCNVEDLALRFRSIVYVLDQIPDMQQKVEQRWKMTANRQKKMQNALKVIGIDEITGKEDEWFDDVFGGALQALKHQLGQVATFIGYQLAFVDMHTELLGSLYHLGVFANPIDPLLAALDRELGRLCGLLPEEYRNYCVKHLLSAVLQGYKYVLLNGGYSRCFSISDADQLANDLNSIKSVFWADGQGIPNLVIQREESFIELKLVIETMKKSLDDLIEVFEEAAKKAENQLDANKERNPFEKQAQSLDYETLLKILCHRADRQASKYLKRHFKIGKK